MNKLIVSFLFLITAACSNQNSQETEKPDISLNAGVGIVTGSGDFGSLGPKDSKILSIKIANTGDAPLQGPPLIDDSNFSIIYQSGCASIAPGKRCDLKISFNASGKAFQSYSGNLNLDSAFLALSATIIDPNPTQTSSVAFSASPLDFGTITDKQSVIKNLTITNSGTTNIENQVVMAPSLSSGFKVVYDNCSNKKILPNKTCYLKISMNGLGLLGALEADLNFAGESVTLTGQVTASSGTTVLGSPDIKLLINNIVSSSYDFGSLSGNESKQVIVYAKNLGNKASEVSTAQLDNTNFSILFNQCSSRVLEPGASCQVRVIFNSVGKIANTYTSSLTFSNQTLNLSAQVVVVNNIITYQPIYSDFSVCSAPVACDGEGVSTQSLIGCREFVNGVESQDSVKPVELCSTSFPNSNAQSCSSPEGTRVYTNNLSVEFSSQTYSCPAGKNRNDLLSSLTDVSCSIGYLKQGLNCILESLPTQPQIVSILPAAGGSVSTTQATEFTINFDRDMDTSTYTNSNIYMNGYSLNIDIVNSTATALKIIVPSGLANNQSYNIYFSNNIKDVNQNPLEPYEMNIYTGTPSLIFPSFQLTSSLPGYCAGLNSCDYVALMTFYRNDQGLNLTFYRERNASGINPEVRMAFSKDGGLTFKNEALPSLFNENFYPFAETAKLKNNNLTLTAIDTPVGAAYSLVHLVHYNGNSWQTSLIPGQSQNSQMAGQVSLAYDGADTIVALYSKNINTNNVIFMNEYSISSNSWATEQQVSFPDIIFSSGYYEVFNHQVGKYSLVFIQSLNLTYEYGLYVREYNSITNTLSSIQTLAPDNESILSNIVSAQNSSGKVMLTWISRENTNNTKSLKFTRYNGINWGTTQTPVSNQIGLGVYNPALAVSDNNSAVLAFAQVGPDGDVTQTSGYAYRFADISVTTPTLTLGTKTRITDFSENFIYAGSTYQSIDQTYAYASTLGTYESYGYQSQTSGFPRIAMSPSGEALITWFGSINYTGNIGYQTATRRLYNRYVPGTGWVGSKTLSYDTNLGMMDSLSYANGKFVLAETIQNQSTHGWDTVVTSLENQVGIVRPVKYVGGYNIDSSFNNQYDFLAFSKTNPSSGSNIGKAVRLFRKDQSSGDNNLYGTTYLKSTDNWATAAPTVVIPGTDSFDITSLNYASNKKGDVAVVWSSYNNTTSLQEIKMRRYLNSGTGNGTWGSVKVVGSIQSGSVTPPIVSIDESSKVYVAYTAGEIINDEYVYVIKGRSYNGDATGNAVETAAQNVYIFNVPTVEFKLHSENGRTVLVHDLHPTDRLVGEINQNFNNPITFIPYAPKGPFYAQPQVVLSSNRIGIALGAPRFPDNLYNSVYLYVKDGSGAFSGPIKVDDIEKNSNSFKMFITNTDKIELVYTNDDAKVPEIRHRSYTSALSNSVSIPSGIYPHSTSIWQADMSSNGTLMLMWINSQLSNSIHRTNIYYSIKQPGLNWTNASFFLHSPDFNNNIHAAGTFSSLMGKIDDFGRIIGVFQTDQLPELNTNQVYSRTIDY